MPQHPKRVKIRRKDLRQPDEFETLTGRALAWAEENSRLLLGVLGAVAAVAVVVLLVNRVGAARNASAAEAFRRAKVTFDAGQMAEAASGFEGVSRDYPRAPFGRLAALYRGHALARQNQAAEAATAYSEYLASASVSYLRQEALTGLGRAKEATGDTAGALEAYAEAGNLDGAFRTDALLNAARLHEAAGHGDQAREIYARLLKESPDAELRSLLLAKLPPGTADGEPGMAAPP
jgi:tetratricopeptide (TPR) repeat protein